MAVIAGGVALLVVAAVVAVISAGGGGGGASSARGGGSPVGGAPIGGTDIRLLDGRLGVAAAPGWEALDSSTDVATLRVPLREANGRQLVATMIVIALPGGGPLDRTLDVPGGTRFAVPTRAGTVEAVAVPGTTSARVVAGTVRQDATLTFSLSVFAPDGQEVGVATLQQLFTEQVVAALRFP